MAPPKASDEASDSASAEENGSRSSKEASTKHEEGEEEEEEEEEEESDDKVDESDEDESDHEEKERDDPEDQEVEEEDEEMEQQEEDSHEDEAKPSAATQKNGGNDDKQDGIEPDHEAVYSEEDVVARLNALDDDDDHEDETEKVPNGKDDEDDDEEEMEQQEEASHDEAEASETQDVVKKNDKVDGEESDHEDKQGDANEEEKDEHMEVEGEDEEGDGSADNNEDDDDASNEKDEKPSAESATKRRRLDNSSAIGSSSQKSKLQQPTTMDAASETASTSTGADVSYEWLDEGVHNEKDDCIHHKAIRLTVLRQPHPVAAAASRKRKSAGPDPETFIVRVGDVVLMQASIDDEKSTTTEKAPDQLICRVQDLFRSSDTELGGGQVLCRWYLSTQELVDLYGDWKGSGNVSLKQNLLSHGIDPSELLLTGLTDVNPVSSILSKVTVDTSNSDPNAFQCRFRLDVDMSQQDYELLPLKEGLASEEVVSEADDDKKARMHAGDGKEDAKDLNQEETNPDDEEMDDDDDSYSVNRVEKVIHEGEGSNLRGNIAVGQKHQVTVGKFVPGQTVRSRNPVAVWKKGKISEEALHDFLTRLAAIHTPYLRKHGLTNEEPYSPLPTAKVEEAMRKQPHHEALTGSSMSTASQLSSNSNALLKECDVDAVLQLLHQHDYDADAALAAAESNLDCISNGWSGPERDIYDESFRRFQGGLRQIAKVQPTKKMQQIVDFHYRFKIPDQFRRYQDKKREQALRMMECIERRIQADPSLSLAGVRPGSGTEGGIAVATVARPKKHWTETATADVTDALDARRRSAKELLLEVHRVMGRESLVHAATLIRQLQKSWDAKARNELFKLLEKQPELQRRFLEFLPKHF